MSAFLKFLDITSFFIIVIVNLSLIALLCYYFKKKFENIEEIQQQQSKIIFDLVNSRDSSNGKGSNDIDDMFLAPSAVSRVEYQENVVMPNTSSDENTQNKETIFNEYFDETEQGVATIPDYDMATMIPGGVKEQTDNGNIESGSVSDSGSDSDSDSDDGSGSDTEQESDVDDESENESDSEVKEMIIGEATQSSCIPIIPSTESDDSDDSDDETSLEDEIESEKKEIIVNDIPTNKMQALSSMFMSKSENDENDIDDVNDVNVDNLEATTVKTIEIMPSVENTENVENVANAEESGNHTMHLDLSQPLELELGGELSGESTSEIEDITLELSSDSNDETLSQNEHQVVFEDVDLSKMKMNELKTLATSHGIKVKSNMKKNDIIEELIERYNN